MSAAAETAPAPPASKGGKKKLMMIVGLLVLLLLLGGGGAVFFLKSKAAAKAAAEAADEGGADQAEMVDVASAPTFVPLERFVVNLIDREVDRYAQVEIVLEVDSPVFADQMKVFMPAIRNAILMILAHKTSTELLARAGKEELADDIAREIVKPMGIQIEPKPPRTPASGAAGDDAAKPAEKPARKRNTVKNPVRRVHFSGFIIQ